ncbi:MAG: FtsH protease activity modulator HflK [Candidatus Dadabacteria bacterium]|nr:MAG: FtsH protease activity modulator HflK [Candidatus Dadabacteria bacterium]
MGIDSKTPEDYQRMAEELFSRFFRGPKGTMFLILLAVIFLGGINSFYTVQPEEEAVVLFFGRYDRTEPPGLHFKIPFVERVIKKKTKIIFEEGFGFYSKGVSENPAISRSRYRRIEEERLMLTGDLNVAQVEWVVQYQISDPRKFLFNTAHPVQNIRDISQATMRRVVGDRTVDDVIRGLDIAQEAKVLTQKVLDKYDMGIRIVSVQIKTAVPPEPVKPSFNEVNAAKQEQEQAINEAEAHYNEIIPKAKGEADKAISEARGRAAAMINEAKGDAVRFMKVLNEYKKAPSITRKRLYLETMKELLSRFKDITIVDSSVKGVLPVFTDNRLKGLKNK